MRKSINLHELREDLQSLLDDVGTTGFPRAKALFLKEVDIVDPEGNPIGAEDVDVEISVGPEVAAALEITLAAATALLATYAAYTAGAEY